MPRMSLEGLRVLDVTQIRAGPKAARWLADAGAEVIKVESVTRPDGRFRVSSALALAGQAAAGARARYTRPIPESAQRETNRAGFDVLHRNKMGLSVNLRSEEGVAIFRALAAISDVVMDNFSQGVMDRLGLGYDDLRKVNPAIIVLSMPAFGSDGPDRSYIGFGWAQEHLSGVTSMTGYEGGPPLRTGTVTPDPLNGVHAAGAVMSALLHRARTGEGQYVELSHWESMISLVGDWLMEYSYNGTVAKRIGNRHTAWAPQGCYPCEGEDRWVALTVTCDEEWTALCDAIGRPELADDPRFAGVLERRTNHDALDEIIGEWSRGRSNYEAMEALQSAGVRSGAVLDNREAITNAHAEVRGTLPRITHPDGVSHPYINSPWQFSRTSQGVRTAAPILGEHNEYLLGEVLGIPDEERRRLESSQVTATFLTPPAE